MKQIVPFIYIMCVAAALTLPFEAQAQRMLTKAQGRSSEKTASDSTRTEGVPTGIYGWHVESRFGTILPAELDTMPHRFQNSAFTEGPTGRYNYTGNLGAPRESRLFADRTLTMQQNAFIFATPYDFFLTAPEELLFTNTRSPFTNLTYHSCGNKQNGEDRITALFSVNAGKKLGMGFKLDYLYGRGYYEAQSTAHFGGTLFASYRDDHYTAHLLYSANHLKATENGGIESDDYVTRPETFPTSYGEADMPINLGRAWNKQNVNTLFFTHRYNLGFKRYRDKDGHIVRADEMKQAFAKIIGEKAATNSSAITTDDKRSISPLSQTATTSATPTDSTLLSKQRTHSSSNAKNGPRLPSGFRMDRPAQQHASASAPSRDAMADSLQLTEEFVPVSSFIHTFRLDHDNRRFTANEAHNATNPGYFADYYLPGDSAADLTKMLSVENTLALEIDEGFNKWVKSGMRLYARHRYTSYALPDAERRLAYDTENYFTLGAMLMKQQGRVFRYNVLGEMLTTGEKWGEFNVEADANLTIPLKKDSITLSLNGFLRNERPTYYFRHYHARNAWWDNASLSDQFSARVAATLAYKSTRLTATLQSVQNYTYFAETLTPYTLGTTSSSSSAATQLYRHSTHVAQASKNIQLLGLTLEQDFQWGPLHWENELTYQLSSEPDALPLPAFNAYTNLYLLFRIAKVLRTELGADLRYFTRYYAPTYTPIIGQYAVQDATARTETGNYPWVNVYANFHLKNTRFYVMASHVNYKSGTGFPFLVPHYPTNRLVLRLGLSWNFFN